MEIIREGDRRWKEEEKNTREEGGESGEMKDGRKGQEDLRGVREGGMEDGSKRTRRLEMSDVHRRGGMEDEEKRTRRRAMEGRRR